MSDDIAVFEGLIDALLDPADRTRKIAKPSRGQNGPRSDAVHAPSKNSGERRRRRRRGGQRRPDHGSQSGPAPGS
jgi:hypothetical protein